MQTVQTQIRLLLQEQSDKGLHCLPFHIKYFMKQLHKKQNLGPKSMELSVWNLWTFTVWISLGMWTTPKIYIASLIIFFVNLYLGYLHKNMWFSVTNVPLLFLPCLSLSSPLLSLLSLFSLSLVDDTKWPTRVDVYFNTNTKKREIIMFWIYLYFFILSWQQSENHQTK